MLGGSGSQRRAGLGFTRGESRKKLGVVGRMRANSTNPFSTGESELIINGMDKIPIAEPTSPQSTTSSSSFAMDAILQKAKSLSTPYGSGSTPSPYGSGSTQQSRERNTFPPREGREALTRGAAAPAGGDTPFGIGATIPSCVRRTPSIPPPPTIASHGIGAAMQQTASNKEVEELKELVEVLQKRLDGVTNPFYGLVKDETIYFYSTIPNNAIEWEENKEGEAGQNEWVPVLSKEQNRKEGTWVSVLYMDPETGKTDAFWTLKSGFAVFSLYPLLDRTVDDFV